MRELLKISVQDGTKVSKDAAADSYAVILQHVEASKPRDARVDTD